MTADAGTRPLILAINPSHAADIETDFWEKIAVAADRRGWQLIQVAARAIPAVDRAITDIYTARLWQYGERMSGRPTRELIDLPDWLSDGDIRRHTEWEHLRWELGTFDPSVVEGAHRLAWFIDDLLEMLRPSLVLTTNKIDHPCAFARSAALHRGITTRLIERSPFEGIWIEPDGLFAESDLWTEREIDLPSYRDQGSRAVSKLIENPAGFRIEEASHDRPEVDGEGPLVFLPMDNLLWTGWGQEGHPQGATDNPAFATPEAGIGAVAEWAHNRGGRVVIKAHPSCVVTPRLHLPDNVELVDGDIAYLMTKADLTVTFNTKLAFLAAAQGLPLAVLADNPAGLPSSVALWRRGETIEAVLDSALDGPPPDSDEVICTYGWMEAEYFYTITEGNRGPERLVADLIESVPAATGPVVSEAEAKQLTMRSKGGRQPRLLSERPRLILDVSRLADPRGRHTGIGRYCDEILDRVVAESPAEVWALVREPGRGWPLHAIDLHFDLRRRVSNRLLSVKSGAKERVLERVLGPLMSRDVFHSTHLGLPHRSLLGRANRVITIHDVLHLKYPKLYDGPKPPTIQRILDTLDKDEDWVITVSDQTRRDLLSIFAKSAGRVRVVPLGVGLPDSGDRSRDRDGFILAMLQAEPRKNLQNTVAGIAKALNDLGDTSTEVVLTVNRQTLEQAMTETTKAGIGGRVRFVVSPSDTELADLFSAAALYVFGSIYEGFGLPPLEALSFGTPTVAVMASSMLEVLGDAVIWATSGSAKDLAVAITAAMRSPHLRAELSELGRRRAEAFTWSRTAASHLEVYEAASIGASS